MDTTRRKELLGAYKNRRPEMGVISFRCVPTGDTFLTPAADTAARFNRLRFQLSAGNCPYKRLQALWAQHGGDAFELRVVKRLEYDDPAEDHTEELDMLCELCLLEAPQAEKL